MGNYISSTVQEANKMLLELGYQSIRDLYQDVPETVYLKEGLSLPEGMSEMEAARYIKKLAHKNRVFHTILRGAGAYDHYIPAIVKSVTAKEEFVTAYTPYQAEISQGILQSIFEYQTMICSLTGMEVANASVYDGATAAAEAAAMCINRKKKKYIISETVNQETIETIKTYFFGSGNQLVIAPMKNGVTDLKALASLVDDKVAGFYLQQPNYYGLIENADKCGEMIHSAGGKFVMGVNPISLGIMKTPREYGADIAVGEGQPMGLPLSFGGPYIGFMAATKEEMRKLPGRIVGETKDAVGRRAYVLTLQAREQHIRREKASSNICSNEALCALTVSVYLAAMGAEGLKQAALNSMSKAHYLAERLQEMGCNLPFSGEYFHEFVTEFKGKTEIIIKALEKEDILGGLPLNEDRILWCCTEKVSKEELDKAVNIIREVL